MLHIHVVWESAEEGKEGELRHQPAGKSNAKGYKKVIRKCIEGNRKLGGSNMKGIRVFIQSSMPVQKLLYCLVEQVFVQPEVFLLLVLSLHLIGHHEGTEIKVFITLSVALHLQLLLLEHQRSPTALMLLLPVLGCTLTTHYRPTQQTHRMPGCRTLLALLRTETSHLSSRSRWSFHVEGEAELLTLHHLFFFLGGHFLLQQCCQLPSDDA